MQDQVTTHVCRLQHPRISSPDAHSNCILHHHHLDMCLVHCNNSTLVTEAPGQP